MSSKVNFIVDCKIKRYGLYFTFDSVLRDTKERGRDIENILHQYTTLVKPAFEEFCLPVSSLLQEHILKG